MRGRPNNWPAECAVRRGADKNTWRERTTVCEDKERQERRARARRRIACLARRTARRLIPAATFFLRRILVLRIESRGFLASDIAARATSVMRLAPGGCSARRPIQTRGDTRRPRCGRATVELCLAWTCVCVCVCVYRYFCFSQSDRENKKESCG